MENKLKRVPEASNESSTDLKEAVDMLMVELGQFTSTLDEQQSEALVQLLRRVMRLETEAVRIQLRMTAFENSLGLLSQKMLDIGHTVGYDEDVGLWVKHREI